MSRKSHQAPISIPEGSFLLDRYQVQKILGKGASGTVYRAFDHKISREVALKIFPASLREDKLASARLHREIRAAHRIDSNNVTNLLECHITDDYIVLSLEYVHGQPLSDLLRQNNILPIAKICRIIRQVSRGLEAIHSQDIVHRDIKLENIMLADDGNVKITDFGISLWSDDEPLSLDRDSFEFDTQADISIEDKKRLTVQGKVVGTLQYISPEYLLGKPCDKRADIYALGVLMYELITGKYIFRYSNHAELMEKKVNVDPKPPAQVRPDCPEWLSNLCMKALHRSPDQRFQSAKEIAFEFNRPGVLFASDDSNGLSGLSQGVVPRTSLMDLHHQSSQYNYKHIRSRSRFRSTLRSIFVRPIELIIGGPLSSSPLTDALIIIIIAVSSLAFAFNTEFKEFAFRMYESVMYSEQVIEPRQNKTPTKIP